MAAKQTVLFTLMPRGIAVDTPTLPVSVIVSPRLMGEAKLGAFPDWVDWTQKLKDRGLSFTVRAGVQRTTVSIDTTPLRPDLWRALFNEETPVRSREFDDYSGHGVLSYSIRESLSALKGVYQKASVDLALPEEGPRPNSDRPGNRHRLAELVDGFDVHWNDRAARAWRDAVRRDNQSDATQPDFTGPLDAEGLVIAPLSPAAAREAAVPFAVYHHIPTPERKRVGPVVLDPKIFDFHQALGALDSHPELLRALGLAFDLDLPLSSLPQTGPTPPYGTMAVQEPRVEWSIATHSPPLETAYVHATAGSHRGFTTATRSLSGSTPTQVVGLLNLDPQRFGLAQVDVDGGMHKLIAVAEGWHRPGADANLNGNVGPEDAPNPEIYDPDATLPSLRSGGLQLFLDHRGRSVLDAIRESKHFNDALEAGGAQHRPFFAEDLVRGYRLDIWDSRTDEWRSLHRRKGEYRIGEDEIPFATGEEEGFFQLAATQAAPGADTTDKDLYIHEAIARWMGWSLSAPMPGKALSRHADPAKAIPPDGDDPDYRTDEAVTPFKVRATYKVVPGSLPRLAFGVRYRVRARAVDLAGNSLEPGDPQAARLAAAMALPRDPEGLVYLRYEPVVAPLVVMRDEAAVTLPGSAVDRVVLRTFNAGLEHDDDPAQVIAADRHVLPPRTSVEMAERLGMFDDPAGKLKSDSATWTLAVARDAGELKTQSIAIKGKVDAYPVESADDVVPLPYLPDLLARGAAFRDLPGSTPESVARVGAGTGASAAIAYQALDDPNPRRGSATLVSFDVTGEWQDIAGFRFALREPGPGGGAPGPHWDPAARVLTVFLPKGRTAVVPLSSYLETGDLKLMGLWQWLRQYVEREAVLGARPQTLQPGAPVDKIAHVLQRAVEGGHWMLTPPRLLTVVHAVQQPIGRPRFEALNVTHEDVSWDKNPLRTARVRGRKDTDELAAITAWRRPNSTEASLMGALKIHGASTGRVDLTAEWHDPVDDPQKPAPETARFEAHVDEIPVRRPLEGYLSAPGRVARSVGYYDPENDLVAMVRTGDRGGEAANYPLKFNEAAPRHALGDTKRHKVTYTAISASRYREYFPTGLDTSRTSEPVVVDVPASARPLSPEVLYVVPTFGWQRQIDTNMKRSVRFGGGLRVYLARPWFSSGEGELLGVTLWSGANGTLDEQRRDKFKPYFTQWGMDPIWEAGNLYFAPTITDFPDAVESDSDVSLEETSAALSPGAPGRADVVGFAPQFDETRGLWFADFTIRMETTYAPFVRLALVRYQPQALDDARISRVTLAGFSQLTPDRAALVTADPHHPRTLRIVVSGLAPRGPRPEGPAVNRPRRPTHVRVRLQKRTGVMSELGWEDVDPPEATVTQFYEGAGLSDAGQIDPDLALWLGFVTFAAAPPAGKYRVLVEEFEYVSATYQELRQAPGRLIYAETFEVDAALLG